jgi:hypothetical protein
MKDALYWTAVFIGIMFIVYVYYYYQNTNKQIESFQTATTTEFSELTDLSSFSTNFVGVRSLTDNNIYTYLTPYTSNITRDGTKQLVYNQQANKWLSLIGNNDFNISPGAGFTVPTTLNLTDDKKGLVMNGIELTGPTSLSLAIPNGNVLPSFSVSMYAQFNNLDFTSDVDIFYAYAQGPDANQIKWSIKPNTATSIINEVTIGETSINTLTWSVPKATFMTNGQNALYTLTYDKTNDKVGFSIGQNDLGIKTLSNISDVILGPSTISINRTKNMNATLRGFVVFQNIVLSSSEITKLDTYFNNLHSGVTQIRAAANNVNNESQTLQTQLNSSRELIQSLSNQLLTSSRQQSGTCSSLSNLTSPSQWQINMEDINNVTINPSDYQSCSFLNINNFGENAAESSPVQSQIDSVLSGSYTPTAPFSDYDIRHPNSTTRNSSTPTSTTSTSGSGTGTSSSTSTSGSGSGTGTSTTSTSGSGSGTGTSSTSTSGSGSGTGTSTTSTSGSGSGTGTSSSTSTSGSGSGTGTSSSTSTSGSGSGTGTSTTSTSGSGSGTGTSSSTSTSGSGSGTGTSSSTSTSGSGTGTSSSTSTSGSGSGSGTNTAPVEEKSFFDFILSIFS